MRRIQGRVFHGLDGDVGAKFLQAAVGDAANGQKVFDAAEGATFLAKIDDSFRSDWADAGQRGQLLERGGVEVEGLGRRLFLGLGRCAGADEHQHRHAEKLKPPFHFVLYRLNKTILPTTTGQKPQA